MQHELKPIRQSMKKLNKNLDEKLNTSRNKKVKIVVSSIATIFLLVLYGMIFSFSEQDGETSGSLSRMISEKCVELLNALSGKGWSDLMMEGLAEYFENPIRKLAHFAEYAVMGMLLFGVWYPWLGLNASVFDAQHGRGDTELQKCKAARRKMPTLVKLVIPWIFLSAALDEVHQLFIPGRCGNLGDVLLDTAGGCFGLLCCILVVKGRTGMCGKKKRKV